MGEAVSEDRQGAVVTLTLNVPNKRNALVPDVREGLIAALERLDEDSDCRAIIITGGPRYFCAGGDISASGPLTPLEVRRRVARPQRLIHAIVHHSKPIIAAVEGPAFGAGFSLAVACDFVMAAEGATFCAAFGRVGVGPDIGLLWSLPLRVGIGTVRQIVMFSDVIGSGEAKTMGLIDWTCPTGSALDFAMERAQALASKATAAIGLSKALLARSPLSLDTVLAHELLAQPVLSTTEDAQEGLAAFAAKRPVQFKGR